MIQQILTSFRKAERLQWLTAVLLIICTIGMGYFVRQDNFGAIVGFFGLFFVTYLGVNMLTVERNSVYFFIFISILLRLLLLPSFPPLSDDIYRFIWDGKLLINGISPFEQLPTYYLENPAPEGIHQTLFNRLNSPEYFTIYPPVAQAVFAFAVWLFPHSWDGCAMVMRAFLIACEIGSIVLIIKLLTHFKLPLKNVLFYAVNPLIIVEIIGNLHFEGAMIFFTLLAIYLLVKNKWIASSGAMTLAVASKLLPLLFLPFLMKRLAWKTIVYGLLMGVILLALFYPLLGDFFINNFGESFRLYFQKFEFNASIYYLARWVGYQVRGYNIIQDIGPVLASFTFIGILAKALMEKQPNWKTLFTQMLFAICLYLTFTTTVHPWYVSLPVVLCLFTRFRFPILWSGMIMLTYINYSYTPYAEQLWMVGVEYIAVGLYLMWELFISQARKDSLYS